MRGKIMLQRQKKRIDNHKQTGATQKQPLQPLVLSAPADIHTLKIDIWQQQCQY